MHSSPATVVALLLVVAAGIGALLLGRLLPTAVVPAGAVRATD